MSAPMTNPRSALHALQPIGRGTTEVESLPSYLCRLAVSHSTSTLSLSRVVAERAEHDIAPGFDWHERKLAGIGESALNMSAALSALTTVEGLDGLTFLPWRDVVSSNGVAIMPRGQFCTHCLAEDRAQGRTPYFRLGWESALVSVCHRHRTPLRTRCPCCGKDNVRHVAALVVPGWCTRCGEFLGRVDGDPEAEALDPSALWQARQVAQLLAAQHHLPTAPTRAKLMLALEGVILQMDGGRSASFARRVGVGKSTVHHWLKGPGTPTLGVSLNIAAQTGLTLTQLLTGNLDGWNPPTPTQQLTFKFLCPEREERTSPRDVDWARVEEQLQAFVSGQ